MNNTVKLKYPKVSLVELLLARAPCNVRFILLQSRLADTLRLEGVCYNAS